MAQDTSALRQKAVQHMIDIERDLHFFQMLLPVNESKQREKFLLGETAEPQFRYLEAQTSDLDFSYFEDDSAIGQLYSDRIATTKRLCALIDARGSDERFAVLSKEIFPVVPLALRIETPDDPPDGDTVGAELVAESLRDALDECGLQDWQVIIEDRMSSRLAVTQLEKKVQVRAGVTIPVWELPGLVRHEIGVHVLRFANGQKQAEPLLHLGTAMGKLIEEGVAMYVENSLGAPRIFMRHRTVQIAQQNTFRETWQQMVDEGETPEKAWGITLRLKRGLGSGASKGGFTRDAIYAQGFEIAKQYLESSGSLPALLSAPIHPAEIGLLEQDAALQIFPPPALVSTP